MPPVAIVTGSASGVGLAAVQLLLDKGYCVIGVDIQERPASLGRPTDLAWVVGDVASPATWEDVSRIGADFDTPSALVACAADAVVKSIVDTSIEDWNRVLSINVLGVVLGLLSSVPLMASAGHGAVAIVCSINSFISEERLGAYSASKAALLSLVRTAALEYGRSGIRVNAVCPGAVDTPLFRRHMAACDPSPEVLATLEARHPLGRLVTTSEVAAALYFLISDASAGITGSAVTVDAGYSATGEFEF